MIRPKAMTGKLFGGLSRLKMITRCRFGFLVFAAFMVIPSVFAAPCVSTTNCTYTFDEHNAGSSGFTTSGPFGTVELTLDSGNIDVTLLMFNNFQLIVTGFPGTFGFNDTLGLGNISASGFSSALYSGSTNNGGAEAHDLHFDGFGDFDDAAATTGPHAGSGISELTFTLSRTSGTFTSVQQLVELSTGGDGSEYFVADAFDPKCGSTTNTACTGLVGVSSLSSTVPEPISSALVGAGLISLFFLRRHFNFLA